MLNGYHCYLENERFDIFSILNVQTRLLQCFPYSPIYCRPTCHLNNGRGSLGGSHAEHGPALIVDPVHVAAPEHEQVENVEVAHAGRRKQGGLALLVEKWLKGLLKAKVGIEVFPRN